MAEAGPPPVGKQIRKARVNAGLSQAALAELAGLGGGQSIVGRWERGDQTPELDSLRQLALALQVSVGELTGGEVADDNSVTNVTGVTVLEADRGVIDAARRLTETLTDSWRRGQFQSLDELRKTAREIAQAYPGVGRGYIEAYLDHFKDLK